MLQELDKGKSIMLVLLDLSSAFDTQKDTACRRNLVLQVLPLICLPVTSRIVPQKFVYLENILKIMFFNMAFLRVLLRVHQFSLHMRNPLLISSGAFQIGYHIYADDTQLYVSFDPKSEEDIATAKSRLTNCIAEIRSWMLANKLKLNDSKTELFLIASPRNASAMSNLELEIGESVITPSGSIKNLGIMFDNNLTMKDHVSLLCRTVNFHYVTLIESAATLTTLHVHMQWDL